MKKRSSKILSIITLITFLVMIFVNVLANAIPINGVTTGEVSASYANLFTPAGITFAIWGLIYFLLFVYTIYQLVYNRENYKVEEMINNINLFYSFSSIVNALWILAWHYDYIFLSVILMIALLASLMIINTILSQSKLSAKNVALIRFPFSIYFGWITIATIANITAYLVSIGWDGLGFDDSVWAIIMIILGAIIGTLALLRLNSVGYGLAVIWGYVGIILKHIAEDGYNGEYPGIIITAGLAIVLLLIGEIIVLQKKLSRDTLYF